MTPNLNSIQEKTDSFDYIKIKGKKGFTAKNTINKRESQMKCKNIYIFATCTSDKELISLTIK